MNALYLVAWLLPVLALAPAPALAQSVYAKTEQIFTLQLRPTQNAPAGARGVMKIEVSPSRSTVRLSLEGLYPDTVYTIWTVFNVLQCAVCGEGHEVPSTSASTRPGFPRDGNGVTPTAPLSSGFTSGMGLDPGMTVTTDAAGNGTVEAELDFDLVWSAPVSSRDIILQCAPLPAIGWDASAGRPICPEGSRTVRVTTTWLRKFIGELPLDERAASCANYDARFDRESALYDPVVAKDQNAALWQCTNPTNGLPRVPFYTFDHFRLANHPDDLTHGFIGGNGTDHWIDMVGRRCDLRPVPEGQEACLD